MAYQYKYTSLSDNELDSPIPFSGLLCQNEGFEFDGGSYSFSCYYSDNDSDYLGQGYVFYTNDSLSTDTYSFLSKESGNFVVNLTSCFDNDGEYYCNSLPVINEGTSSGGGTESESSTQIVSSEQVNSIGSAVVQGGTSLVGIGIQLLPYLICFVIILIIFLFIKRISNLKNKPLQ